nr:zinc knuckle CX2CX4HX4C [Tanacetum cinerariifolium]
YFDIYEVGRFDFVVVSDEVDVVSGLMKMSSYARAMIELWANVELKDTIVVGIVSRMKRGFLSQQESRGGRGVKEKNQNHALINEEAMDGVIPFATVASGNYNGKQDENVGLCSYTTPLNEGRSSYARAMIELWANVELKDTIVVGMPKLVGGGVYMCTIHVEYEWKPSRCSSCKVFGHILDECPKNICSDVVKNLKTHRQAARGVQVGPKDDDDLGMNCRNSKSAGKGSVNVTHGSSSNTPIIEKIDKLERQILDGKLKF